MVKTLVNEHFYNLTTSTYKTLSMMFFKLLQNSYDHHGSDMYELINCLHFHWHRYFVNLRKSDYKPYPACVIICYKHFYKDSYNKT